MSSFEKALRKFNRVPIPKDITFNEVVTIAEHLGCEIRYKRHPQVVHRISGTVIPVPHHNQPIKEAYVEQLKVLFNSIVEETI